MSDVEDDISGFVNPLNFRGGDTNEVSFERPLPPGNFRVTLGVEKVTVEIGQQTIVGSLPGDKDSSIHWRCVISCSRNLIISEVLCTTKLFILPVAKALQGPLSVVTNGQLGLWETNRN